jgi:hypothetical protein
MYVYIYTHTHIQIKRTNLTANNLVADKGFAYFSALGTVTVSPYTGSPVGSYYLLIFFVIVIFTYFSALGTFTVSPYTGSPVGSYFY